MALFKKYTDQSNSAYISVPALHLWLASLLSALIAFPFVVVIDNMSNALLYVATLEQIRTEDFEKERHCCSGVAQYMMGILKIYIKGRHIHESKELEDSTLQD